MNRERISEALNCLDNRHISETMVFAPDAMQGATGRSKTMHKKTYRNATRRFTAIFIAACLVMSLGIVAYAAFAGGWFSGRDAEIAPTNTQQFIIETGFDPIRIHSFGNGYTCVNNKVLDNQTTSSDGSTVFTFKSAMFEYEKDGDRLYFGQDNSPRDFELFGDPIESHNGTELWYYFYTNKFVPEGYEMTASEKESEKKGELIITYGSDEIFSAKVQSLSWCMDGINYNLMQTDGALSAEELCTMAKEIMDGGVVDASIYESNKETGNLLDSGYNLNDNYYKKMDFSGKITDLTGTSFLMGKEIPATNMQTGTEYPGTLTIHYDENTTIKTAKLYYSEDRYEIYAGSISDLVISPDYLYEIILEDSNSAELWAKEIIISEFIF